MMPEDPTKLVDWASVRNEVACVAERCLGAVRWGWSETDVIIMRDCCLLDNNKCRAPKLSPNSDVKKCCWCDEYFLSSEHYVRHLLVVHIQWNCECGVCRKPISGSIARHPCSYSCPVCDIFTCTSKKEIVKHVFVEHEKFYCILCDKVHNDLEAMKAHVEEENNLLSKSCILCKRNYSNSSSGDPMKNHLLKVHFGTNTSKKGPVFEDRASKESDLELITQISLSYRPNKTERYQFDNYKCAHCHRLFSAQSGLKIHVGIAHRGVKILFCPRCPGTFKSIESCKKHLKEEHGNNRKRKKHNTKSDVNEYDGSEESTEGVPPERKKSKSYVSTNVNMTSGELYETETESGSREDNLHQTDESSRVEDTQTVSYNTHLEKCGDSVETKPEPSLVEPSKRIESQCDAVASLSPVNVGVKSSRASVIKTTNQDPLKLVIKCEPLTVCEPKPPQRVESQPEPKLPQLVESQPTHVATPARPKVKSKKPLPGLLKIGDVNVVPGGRSLSSAPQATLISLPATTTSILRQALFTTSGPKSKQLSSTLSAVGPVTQQLLQHQLPTSLTAVGNLSAAPLFLSSGIVTSLLSRAVTNTLTLAPDGTIFNQSSTGQKGLVMVPNQQKESSAFTILSSSSSQFPISSPRKLAPKVPGWDQKVKGEGRTPASNSTYILPKPSVSSLDKKFENVQVIFPNQIQDSAKVYVPAVTPSGSTILIDLDEAHKQMQVGAVTFVPRDQTSPDSEGAEDGCPGVSGGQPNKTETLKEPGSFYPKIVSVKGSPEKDQSTGVMRDKVALNLPVVLTKRSNKKLAQDNPFFEVSPKEGCLLGNCRVCGEQCKLQDTEEMETHFKIKHKQIIQVKRFKLYYEISYRPNSRTRTKYFICFYCGKEFTTKFNVRRHQMLYCPRKDEIDPRELGLGVQEEVGVVEESTLEGGGAVGEEEGEEEDGGVDVTEIVPDIGGIEKTEFGDDDIAEDIVEV